MSTVEALQEAQVNELLIVPQKRGGGEFLMEELLHKSHIVSIKTIYD